MVASSNFKAPGFTEAVMQMNFWITHYLVHLNTLSSSWYFCVYFRQAQAFPCIPTASLTLDISYFFWQRRIEIRWSLGQQTSIIITRITSILLGLGSRGLKKKWRYNVFQFSRDQVVNVSPDFVGEVHSSHVITLLSLGYIGLMKVEI